MLTAILPSCISSSRHGLLLPCLLNAKLSLPKYIYGLPCLKCNLEIPQLYLDMPEMRLDTREIYLNRREISKYLRYIWKCLEFISRCLKCSYKYLEIHPEGREIGAAMHLERCS